MRFFILILFMFAFTVFSAPTSPGENVNPDTGLQHANPDTYLLAQKAINENKTSHHRMIGELGFSKFADDYYLNMILAYEFNFKNMGLGVILPLNFMLYCGSDVCEGKTTYRIRNADWDDVSDWFKFIKYFRYGYKGDEKNKYYLRFGQLANVSLGHGTIVSNYMNYISWYEFKPGIQFDYYSKYGGVETLVDNFIPTELSLLGLRAFVRPLGFFIKDRSYFTDNFSIGLSFITDIKAKARKDEEQFEYDNYKYKSLSILGLDMEFQVYKNDYIAVIPFIDFNSIIGKGSGIHIGVDTRFHIALSGAYFSLRPEFRGMSDQYEPGYFNSLYEAHKMGAQKDFKYSWLENREAKKGVYIEGKYEQYLLNSLLFELKMSYEDYEGDDNSSFLIYASVPFLESYKFSGVYAKSRFGSFSDIFSLDSALLILEGVFTVYDPFNLRLQYQKTWYEEDNVLKEETSWNIGVNVSYTFE